jgi:hypothetical protein
MDCEKLHQLTERPHSRLLTGPGFVKHDNLLDGDIVIADVLITKVMNILYKATHLALRYFL